MKTIGVIGMGYVGITEAVMLSTVYDKVIGFQRPSESGKKKMEMLNRGENPLDPDEPLLGKYIGRAILSDTFECISDFYKLSECDAIIITVQTDTLKNLKEATKEISRYMKPNTLVVVVSTVPPTTTKEVVKPILDCSGKPYYLAHAPERVTPGKLIHNFTNVPRVIGGIDKASTDKCIELYTPLNQFLIPMTALEAEICKCAENGIRDLQIAVSNELALICQENGANYLNVKKGIDSLDNISTRALKNPGIGVGGHCLTKDGLFLSGGDEKSLFAVAREINNTMPWMVRNMLEGAAIDVKSCPVFKRIGLFGISYTGNTRDTRNSPALKFKEIMEDRGSTVIVFDPVVGVGSFDDAAMDADAIVIGCDHDVFKTLTPDQFDGLLSSTHKPILIDGRGILDLNRFQEAGWICRCVGRGDLL